MLELLLQLRKGGIKAMHLRACQCGLVEFVLARDLASSVAVASSRGERVVEIVGARATWLYSLAQQPVDAERGCAGAVAAAS